MNFEMPNLYHLTTSRNSVLSAPTVNENAISQVYEIKSLSQISTHQPNQTLFLFDLDDTLFDSPYMVGSKAWRRYIADATKKIDGSENWHDIFSYFLAQNHPMKAVEEITSSFVRDLQRKHVICGLTSRERKIWYDTPHDGVDSLTCGQLRSIDIDLNNGSLENVYPYLSTDSEYFNGVFFANQESKGNYLLHLFENAPQLPQKVIFIDDKPSQVKSVSDALIKLGIPHECYIYYATEEKGKQFDPLIANIQLFHLYASNGQTILSDQQAALIAKDNPEKDADYYLQAAMEMAIEKQ